MQGGIHPDYTGEKYLDICRIVKTRRAGHSHPRLLAARSPAGRGEPARFRRGVSWRTQARGSRHAARHGGRDSRRRGARDPLPRQAEHRAMARSHARRRTGSACARPRRSCSGMSIVTSTGRGICCASARLQQETGGFTEFVPLPFVAWRRRSICRAARVRGRLSAKRFSCTPWRDSRLHPRDPQHPGVLGQARRRRPRRLPRGRRQRPRRHADGREHFARRRRVARPRDDAAALGGDRARRRPTARACARRSIADAPAERRDAPSPPRASARRKQDLELRVSLACRRIDIHYS